MSADVRPEPMTEAEHADFRQASGRPEGASAFVYDVQVRPERRRRGYGRAVMPAAGDSCRVPEAPAGRLLAADFPTA